MTARSQILSSRLTQLMLALTVIALLAYLLTVFFQPHSVYPSGASPVAGTENGMGLNSPWYNSHEVFTYDRVQANLIDITTGARVPVPNFGDAGGIYSNVDTSVDANASVQAAKIACFSPDGKWLLWMTGPETQGVFMATQVPIGRLLRRPLPKPVPRLAPIRYHWLSDSRRWEETYTEKGQDYALTYSVDTPQVSRTCLGPSTSLADMESQQAPGTLPFPTPSGTQVLDSVASPDGKRVAWLSSADDNSINFSYLIGSLVKLGRIPHSQIPRHWVGLWVSRNDGSDAHRVLSDFSCQSNPTGLSWAPDGKRLGFCYDATDHTMLWTVPVNS